MTFIKDSTYEIEFNDREIDQDLKEIFSDVDWSMQESKYHKEELEWWLKSLERDYKEVINSIDKIKYHLSQIA